MAKFWVFDLDGTLMDTMFLYGYSYLDAARLILDDIGGAAPHVSVLVNLIKSQNDVLVDATNPATGRPYKYDRRRFPTALQQTYENVCRKAGRVAKPALLRRLWEIGDMVFDPIRYPGVIRPEARPLLTELKERGDRIVILTKGDDTVQNRKLAALTAAGVPYIAGIVVEDAKDERFAEFLEHYQWPDEQYIAVGDTYDADIAPAITLGYSGIWIAEESWQQIGMMDGLRVRAANDGVTIINGLPALMQMVHDGTI